MLNKFKKKIIEKRINGNYTCLNCGKISNLIVVTLNDNIDSNDIYFLKEDCKYNFIVKDMIEGKNITIDKILILCFKCGMTVVKNNYFNFK